MQGPLATPGRDLEAAASSSLGLPAASTDRAALPPVPNPPLDFPLPDLASLHYPRRSPPATLLRWPVVRGLGVRGSQVSRGAKQARKARSQRRPLGAGSRHDPDWDNRPGTLPQSQAICPEGFRPTPTPGSRPRLPPQGQAARGRAFERGDWTEGKQR